MLINIDDTDFDDDLRYFYQGEPFTGEAVETNPAGQVIALTTFRNGIEHGPHLGWYPDGVRRYDIKVVNGNAVGTSQGQSKITDCCCLVALCSQAIEV